MTDPRVPRPPRPPHHRQFDDEFPRAVAKTHPDSVPPAVRQHISEHDVKVDANTMAMARAVTNFQTAVNERLEKLTRAVSESASKDQVAALHGYQITLRNYLVRQSRARMAIGAIMALLGGALTAWLSK